MSLFDENTASQLVPDANIQDFQQTMGTPFRGVLQTLLAGLESTAAALFAFSVNPDNAPLIGLRFFNERAADPIQLVNVMLRAAMQGVVSDPFSGQ